MTVGDLIIKLLRDNGYYCTIERWEKRRAPPVCGGPFIDNRVEYIILGTDFGKIGLVLTIDIDLNKVSIKKTWNEYVPDHSSGYCKRYYPSTVLCDNVDMYHPNSLRTILRVVKDVYGKPKLIDKVARVIQMAGKYYKKFKENK